MYGGVWNVRLKLIDRLSAVVLVQYNGSTDVRNYLDASCFDHLLFYNLQVYGLNKDTS